MKVPLPNVDGGEYGSHVIGMPVRAGTDEAHADAGLSLWWAPLDISATALRGLASCLSPEESRRSDLFHRPLDRARFLAARGWLRRLLADQLLCAPGEVRIVTSDGGKPRLAGTDLCFSAARSAGIALYATSWRMDVGVDVEAIRPADVERIAARFFSQGERRALASLPPAQRLAASFQCWTRKEAYAKGIGAGLTFPLRSVEVWAGGRQHVTVSGWSVHQVDMAAPGFAAAVAGAGLADRVPKAPRELRADVGLVGPGRTTVV
jgi:4'-phosphopantetheinyl transferase